MSNDEGEDIEFSDALETGSEAIKDFKRFIIHTILSIRNSINRRHWFIRGSIKTIIGGIAVEILLQLSRFLLKAKIPFGKIATAIVSLLGFVPTVNISQTQVFISFIGLFIVFESIQLRRLSRIERLVAGRTGLQPDGGQRQEDNSDDSSSGGGAVGGAIAGAALGSAFGPEGTVLGAVAGALFGNELEKSQTPKRSGEIKCALVSTLVRQHGWGNTIPRDIVIRKAVPPEDRQQAKQVWEELSYEPFILATERGYRLDPNKMDQLAEFLRNHCGWSEERIQTHLHHYNP